MAKITGPFKIKGTLGNINFYVTQNDNLAREKGKTGVSSKEFKSNPIFEKARNHGTEFGHCTKKSRVFRQLASRFNRLAKEGSFAGRANKLLLEILQEDTSQPQGKRTLQQGMQAPDSKELLLYFESNKYRPLKQVLKTNYHWNPTNYTLELADFLAKSDLDWPEEATHVVLATATADWNIEKDSFEASYSPEIELSKEALRQTIRLSTEKPTAQNLHLSFLFIGFRKHERKKSQFLHRKFNTATLIAQQTP